jgi:pimeloyl-ACP methyl ester carboxylesterase
MFTNKNILYENTDIHYAMYGSGKAVMLVHGFGEDSDIWKAQIEYLQKDFLLIVPDIPGSGQSQMLKKGKVEIEDYATILKVILEEEKITDCCMLGHSMGGYISLAFADKYPEKLWALGLIHSSAYADDALKIEARRKAIEFITENGSYSFLKSSTPNLFFDVEKSKKKIDELIEKGGKFLPEALIQYYLAMIARVDTTTVLIEFNKPVLFIIGEHDKAVPFAQSLPQTHLPSISYVYIMRNSGHMSMLEETEKCNKILAEFLHYR